MPTRDVAEFHQRHGHEVNDIVIMYAFRLYVAGQSERSQAAETNLRGLCESFLPGRYELEVIDAAEQPGLAEEQRILATPTVLRLAPSPQRRVIGDLSDHRRAADALGLSAEAGSAGGTRSGDPA